MLTIRRAESADTDAVRDLYHRISTALNGTEFDPLWREGIYPTEEMLQESIAAGELYLGEKEQEIVAAMMVNGRASEEYRLFAWPDQRPMEECAVIHALGVDPRHMGQGCARQMAEAAKAIARQQGKKALRMDVLQENLPAARAYTHAGFIRVGDLLLYYEDTGWRTFDLYTCEL